MDRTPRRHRRDDMMMMLKTSYATPEKLFTLSIYLPIYPKKLSILLKLSCLPVLVKRICAARRMKYDIAVAVVAHRRVSGRWIEFSTIDDRRWRWSAGNAS